jgi:hypothetical protein
MGNSQSMQKINYEDVQYVIKNAEAHILINTLNENEQDCLLPNTIGIHKEVDLINSLIKHGNKKVRIIVYGRNSNDENFSKSYYIIVCI